MSTFTASGPSADIAAPPAAFLPGNDLYRLVQRVTFGATREEYRMAQTLGPAGYLERHLRPDLLADDECDRRLRAYPTLQMEPPELADVENVDTAYALMEAKLIRAVYSKRQLFERAVDLWTDHFNVFIYADVAYRQKAYEDRTVARAHALGSFPAMLRASCHSPSMLNYLNNDTNEAGHPNENFSREMLELHSMGVDGGYTQADVREVARAFTGWEYNWEGPDKFRFLFSNDKHDPGPKSFLGVSTPANNGQNDGETVITTVATHASTGRFVAGKLLNTFFSETAPASMRYYISQVYRSTGGNIGAMVRAIFAEGTQRLMTPKFKRPLHLAASLLRVLGADLTEAKSTVDALDAAGHAPFAWIPPNGYPDKAGYWVQQLLPRWNFCAELINGGIGGVEIDLGPVFDGASTPAQVATRINQTLHMGFMPRNEIASITAFLAAHPMDDQRKRDALGLAASMPAFQWY